MATVTVAVVDYTEHRPGNASCRAQTVEELAVRSPSGLILQYRIAFAIPIVYAI